jgi:hypothetical protein
MSANNLYKSTNYTCINVPNNINGVDLVSLRYHLLSYLSVIGSDCINYIILHVLVIKAACLQIHANFPENFENVLKRKILLSEQRK